MNKIERLAKAPMSSSSADFLVQEYESKGTTIDSFAEGLPRKASIIDVASGLSDFGLEIARRRDDITWVNFDIKYEDPESFAALKKDAPDNLIFVSGDALALSQDTPGEFDRVYSYCFLPHVLRINRNLGGRALTSMITLLNPTGLLMAGPTSVDVGSEARRVVSIAANQSRTVIDEALDALTIPRRRAIVHDAMDASGVSIFSSERVDPEDYTKLPILFDHRSETYHHLVSKQGFLLAGRLATGFLQRNKFEEPA